MALAVWPLRPSQAAAKRDSVAANEKKVGEKYQERQSREANNNEPKGEGGRE